MTERVTKSLSGLLTLLLVALSAPLTAADFGLVFPKDQVSTRQNAMVGIPVDLKTVGGFDGEVDFRVDVDPDATRMDVELSASGVSGSSGTLNPSEHRLGTNIDVMPSLQTAPGEYTITLTLTGYIDGERVERKQSMTLVVAAPEQFEVSLAPKRIVVKQGGSATTTVTTQRSAGFGSTIALAAMIPDEARWLSVDFSGGGRRGWELWSQSWSTWVIEPEAAGADGRVNTTLTVMAAPETPSGEYRLGVQGTYNPRTTGSHYDAKENTRFHEVPLIVEVIADEQYAHLQDPTRFDLLAEDNVIEVMAGGPARESWVAAWGDRWGGEVVLTLAMSGANSAVSARLSRDKVRLQLPDSSRAYEAPAWFAAGKDTPQGDYPAVLTGVSTAPDGRTLTRSMAITVRVVGTDAGIPHAGVALPADGAVRPSDPYVQDYRWPGDYQEAANALACEMLSEAADTIACSVHTFKKPDTESAETDPDLEVGHRIERADGTTETELFVRNPDDNNLRQGCGDLTDDVLIGLSNTSWPFGNTPPETRYEYIACNAAAQPDAKGKAELRAVLNKDVPAECGAKPTPKQLIDIDPREVVEGSYKDSEKLANSAIQMATGKNGAERLAGLAEAFEATDSSITRMGLEYAHLKTGSEAIKGTLAASGIVADVVTGNQPQGEDLKGVLSGLKTATGIEAVDTVSSAFDVAVALKTLNLKIEGKGKVTYDDISGLIDKINTLRGDKFKALGSVLEGVKENIGTVQKAEEMVGKLGEVVDFINRQGEPQTDPMELYDGFTKYIEVIGGVAEQVPAMGEFMGVYTDALKTMRANVQTLVDAKGRSEAAVASWNDVFKSTDQWVKDAEAKRVADEARAAALGENDIAEDWQTFKDGWEPPTGDVRPSEAQKIYNDQTYAPRKRMEEARDQWRRDQDCVVDSTAAIEALTLEQKRISKEYHKTLPPQAELEARYEQMRARKVYFETFGTDPSGLDKWQGSVEEMGFKNRKEAEDAMRFQWDKRGKNNFIDDVTAAQDLKNRRDYLRRRWRDIRQQLENARKRREDCGNRLAADEIEYLQALRDYTAVHAHHYFNVVNKGENMGTAQQRHDKMVADALAAIDSLIAAQGFAVDNGKVVITIIDDCNTQSQTVTVGK